MDFHDHLKRLREAKGLTQAQVAEAIDTAKNTYIGYEKGTREPRLSELKKLAALFHIELGELCLEAQSAGLTGWLKIELKRAQSLRAKEKAALAEVMHGYIKSCQIARISHESELHDFVVDPRIQEIEEEELEALVRQETAEEEYEKYVQS